MTRRIRALSMNVATNNQETFTADFDAVVDSVISYAPGFVAAGYTITPSDGVGIYVPEPGDGRLTSAAVGALLCLGWRRPPPDPASPTASRHRPAGHALQSLLPPRS
ncbi:MAG TPA: hypothetical protein VMH82_03020 [Myxococcota bacterium]|nr:hypothetical protein [Myxococcota bacterium]